MTLIAFDDDEPRTIKALLMAVGADTWPRVEKPDGTWFLIPSQSSENIAYLTNGTTCGCPDYARRSQRREAADVDRLCKHALAARLYLMLVKASTPRTRPAPTRRHIRAR